MDESNYPTSSVKMFLMIVLIVGPTDTRPLPNAIIPPCSVKLDVLYDEVYEVVTV